MDNNNKLKLLNGKKELLFSRVQRLYDDSKKINIRVNLNNFKTLYPVLEETRRQFDEVILQINEVSAIIDAENYRPDLAALESFNELYCKVQEVAKEVFKTGENSNDSTTRSPDAPVRTTPRLPKLTIPTFNASDLTQWPVFQECFTNLIHNNSELTSSDKVHYLIGALSGKALSVCTGIPTVGSNYNVIWDALCKKYDDKRLLANVYLDRIFEFKPLQSQNADDLNNFLIQFDSTFRALKNLGISDLTDHIMAYLALKKLDSETVKLYENSHRNSALPSYENLVTFVNEQVKICSRSSSRPFSSKTKFSGHNSKSKLTHSFVSVQNTSSSSQINSCVICGASHTIQACPNFLSVEPTERYTIVRNKNLCLNCLGNHRIVNCKSKIRCKTCGLKHNSYLHFKKPQSSPFVDPSSLLIKNHHTEPCISAPTPVKPLEGGTNNPPSLCALSHNTVASNYSNSNSTVLLSTAVVDVFDKFGQKHTARIILDTASQRNIITLRCCKRLNLSISKCFSTIQGIGPIGTDTRGQVDLVIVSQVNPNCRFPINALVVDNISDKMPAVQINTCELSYLAHLPLADKDFHKPSSIDLIVGSQVFPYILGQSRMTSASNFPVAIETSLGYVVMGEAPTFRDSDISSNFCTIIETPLEQIVERFWELDSVPTQPHISPDDVRCEEIYLQSYQRLSSGRYSVALPFKYSFENLGDSYQTALRRFLVLEKRLTNQTNLRKEYVEIIKDYIVQGHMSKVSTLHEAVKGYYIPHHAVFKVDSPSTPVRIVFDASCKTDNNYSLNDLLFNGPKLQSDVCTMFLKFRLFAVAFTADIRQMYRQINLHPDHRKFQRILWRFSPNDPIETYELNTVAFGVKSSPYLAMRTISQLAEDEKSCFPLASEVVKRDMYVDDLVSSTTSLDLAFQIYSELVAMFARGGFPLVKWATNSKHFLDRIPLESRTNKVIDFETDTLKVLGLQWHPSCDTLAFSFKFLDVECTKRNILSTVARCYDPLGFLAPVTLIAKLLIKELWSLKLGWDETPPTRIVDRWNQFKSGLSLLLEFKLPRHIETKFSQSVVLIGFSDACLTSYGAVVYLRSLNPSGKVVVHLLIAKSKVSPMNVISIPRLELCAAYLLSKLIRFVVDSYQPQLNITDIFALSDSSVALNWIATNSSQLKTFVANRVSKIQSLTDSNSWYHVEGKNNISDGLSRGIMPSHFMDDNGSWQNGPEWLKLEPPEWPILRVKLEQNLDNLPDTKTTCLVATNCTNDSEHPLQLLALRISKWSILVRSVVYVLRFLRILPREISFSATDLQSAELALIKEVQCRHFHSEIALLQNDMIPPKLKHLRPFLHEGIIRVGGRLINSQLDFDGQHPILLPKRDRVVELLIDHYHATNLHIGPHLVLSLLRLRYWILAARSVVRYRIQHCNTCFRLKPKPQIPIMGNLPGCRVQAVKAFMRTGCDYAGPVQIIPYRKRGVRPVKAYICVFVCMATKAVHFELVTDLSTPNFMQAFKRFLSRRGVVSEMHSDNGTNFMGAKAILDDLYKIVASSEFNNTVRNEFATLGITWKLIPPGAPHFGSLWELSVKALKILLYKHVNNQLLTYEEFNTVLIQIEALLNSRPLCVLSSDPSDPTALTPAHFLTVMPVTSLPASDVTNDKVNRLDRFKLIDRIVQDLWKRWRLEYLTTLQVRQRWNLDNDPVTAGKIVLFELPNTPPLHWPIGIIEKTYPGSDNIVRVVDVRTKNGTYKRPVTKVYPLPLQ